MIITEFVDLIAERMRAEHGPLAARWFERLLDLLPVDARDIFPSESLLDHIPALILDISRYLQQPEVDAFAANTAVLEKARELGSLRHAQRASLHQLLREYQVLDGILVTFVLEEMERLNSPPSAAESVILVSRLHQAVNVLTQSTVEAFVSLWTQTIAEQRERLELFTRLAAHEWRQPLGALQFGVRLLGEATLDAERSRRTLDNIERSVGQLVEVTHKLERVTRMNNPTDSPAIQEVSVATVAAEAARQLREMADARGVEIRVSESLPALAVDVGRLELVFVNLLSNAIKYSDLTKTERLVSVTGGIAGATSCRIDIHDNGVGIPAEALSSIFRRFTRAHTEHPELVTVGGIGLGLSIVEDCVRGLGGQIAVESEERVGTTFTLTLPLIPPQA